MILSFKSEELMITHSKFMNYSRFVSNKTFFFFESVNVYTVCFFDYCSPWSWSVLDLMSFVIYKG